ncbi:MAG: LytTR family DNA-binding domain-containing protein [Bacteroidota bacterium]
MRLLIIEDEAYAVDELKRLLGKVKLPSEPEVLNALDSIEAAVRWLRTHPHPNLVFLDIQLADGMSFDIFKQVDINCPVIFTTAYDEYAIRAFKMNSIDYLLKPIELTELQAAFDKYFKLRDSFQQPTILPAQLMAMQKFQAVQYKSRFVSRIGDKFRFVLVEDVTYFFAEDKTVYAVTLQGDRHIIDFTLESLEPMLDPALFFRLNRTYISRITAIEKAERYYNGRMIVFLQPKPAEDVIVSKEKAQRFRVWLGG